MRLKKHIAQLLTVGLLLNNIYFNANANNMETLDRYETLEGEQITIDNSTEGELVEIEVFGNTLQDENNLEDIQSVGDLYVDENGDPILDKQDRKQYEVNILSRNKNLFNHSNNIDDYNSYLPDTFEIRDDGSVLCRTASGNLNYLIQKEAVPMLENMTYTLSFKAINYYEGVRLGIRFLNNNGDIIKDSVFNSPGYNEWYNLHYFDFFRNDDKVTFKAPLGTTACQVAYLGLSGNTGIDIAYEIENVQLEQGDIATEYESSNFNNTIILLPTQLQKVGDIADKLYWDNEKGRYVIEKNFNKWVITAKEESWRRHSDYTPGEGFSGFNFTIDSVFPEELRPKFFGLRLGNNGFGVWAGHASKNRGTDFHDNGNGKLVIEEDIIPDDNLDMLKEWLESNHTYIYYQLQKPICVETNITSKLKIPIYDGKTYVFVNSENGINPTLKVTVDRIMNRAKEAIEAAKINPTMENISLARMWINMLDDSALKDSFQDNISEITEVVDLTIDKKKASANLDVYIKSSNSLTMSLSTNSITFENYSGVESMEKLNTVNITVNSSLPYELNAYMPTPMSSSDGKTMAMNVVNIKDNSESNYSQFVSTTDKVVLKDSCEAGDNNIHNIDLKLSGGNLHEADIYRTVLKFEAVQK